MDIRGLVEQMVQGENFQEVINNPLAQFGTPTRRYLGAELLPEKEVPENAYVEESIRYRTIVANDGTRYSPVQIKAGVLTGTFNVVLADSDIGSHFTGADYDALVRLLLREDMANGTEKPSPAGIVQMTNWSDSTLNMPLMEKNEKMRWEAITNATITRTGDDNFTESVPLSNPTGHRVSASGTWSNNSYDPYVDIMAGMEFMAAKGYTVTRIVSTNTVRGILARNALIRSRVGRLSIAGGTIVGLSGHASLADINQMLSDDGLPPIELYDLQYRTSTGTARFLRSDALVMFATTGRNMEIDLGDTQPLTLEDTIGYCAVGRPVGQSGPGRVIKIRAIDDSKPPRVEGEAWQTSLPVIQEPESIYVITGIA